MAKTYRTGLVITGDASDGVKAINLTRDQLDKLNKTGQKTRTQMRETSAESERFTASLGHVAHKAAAWTAAFVGVNAIMGQFTQQLSSVDRIHKLNLRIGASTEALSEYAYVAELSGTNIEQLAVAWQRQTRRIAEAAQGTGVAKAALEELNLSATTLRTLAPEDQFMAIAGALENVAEKGDRLRLANAIFDSEGAAAALQIINQGTDAMDRMIERAQKLGATVFQDQANSIATYNDAVTDMRYAWEGVNRVLAVNMAESATDGLIELAEVIPTVTNALEYLDEAMIAGVAVTAGRAGGALAEKTKKLVASSQAARAAAESELYLAKQAQMRAVQDQAAAQRSLANAASMEARSAAGTRLARANQQVIATTKLMDAATANYQRTATLAGRAAAGLRNTMAFFGGPLGVVTMAVTAFALLSPRLFDNKTRIEELSEKAKEGANQLRNMAAATNQLSIAQAQANMVATAELLDDQSAAAQAAGAEVERLKAAIAGMKIGDSPMQEFAGQVRALEKQLELAVKTHSDLQANVTHSEQAYNQAKGAIDEIFSSQEKFNAALVAGGASSDELTGSNEDLIDTYIKLKAQLDEATNINKRYDDLIKEIIDSDIEAAKKTELLAAAEKKRAQDLEQLNKRQQDNNKGTKDAVDKNQQLIQSLGDEIELMQLSGRERAIQTELRKLDTDATESQILAIRHLAGVNYDQQQAALAAKDELKLAAEQTTVWADITENAVNSVDNSFRELFRSGLDGWDDFWDQMLDTAKDMLAELAYTLVKQQLWVNVGMNVTGQGGAVGAASSAGNLVSTGKSIYDIYTGNNSVVNTIGSWLGFGGASAATTTAGYGAFASAMPSTAGYLGMGTGATTATSGLVGLGGTATSTAGAFGAASAGWGAAGMAAAVVALPFVAGWLDSYFGGDKSPAITLANMSADISDVYKQDLANAEAARVQYQNDPMWQGENDVPNWSAVAGSSALGDLLGLGSASMGDRFSETSVETPFGMLGVGRAAYMGETNLAGVKQFLGAVKNIDEDLARYLSVQQIESISESLADWVYDGGGEGSTVAAEIGRQLRERLGIQLDVIDQELAAFVNDAGEGISQQNLERFSAESQVATLALAMEGTLDVVAIGINQFKALSLEGENTAQTITRTLTQTMAVMDVLDAIELNFSGLGDEMLVTADRLVKLSGGIDALTSSANYYYQNYFTEQERARHQVEAYTAMLGQFNAEFDTALSGRDDLRAFVESLDLTSDAGQKAYAAAMQLAPALQGLEAALSSVNEQVGRLDTYVEEQALAMQSALADGMDAALAALDTSVAAERTRLTEQYSAITDGIVAGMNTASAAVSRLQGLSDSLYSTIDRMRPIAFASQDYQSAQAQLREILQETRAGAVLPESGQLSGMFATLARGDADQFGSRSAYLLDYARTARQMDELAGIADQRQSVQERAIATAELQLDLLERQHTDDLARLDNIVATAQEQVAIANGTYQTTLSLTDGVFNVYQAIAEYRAFTGQNSDEQNAAFMDLVAEQLGEAATIQLAGYEGTAARLDALLTVTELANTATPEALDLLQASVDAGYQALLVSLAESHAANQTASAELQTLLGATEQGIGQTATGISALQASIETAQQRSLEHAAATDAQLLALLGGGVDAQLANGERLTDVLDALGGVADAAVQSGQMAVADSIEAAAASTRALLDTLTNGQVLSTQQTDRVTGQLVVLGNHTDGVADAVQTAQLAAGDDAETLRSAFESTGAMADLARARLLTTLTSGQGVAEGLLSEQVGLAEQLKAELTASLSAQHLTLLNQSDMLTSQQDLASQSVTWLEQIHSALTAEHSGPDRIDALYQLMLGREADAAGRVYWEQQLAAVGGDIGAILPAFRSGAIYHGEVPAFATGGHYKGGVALVGERGPELINFDAPGQVYTANQTNDIFSAMARELAQLRAELAELRKEQRAGHAAIAANTGKTNRMLDRAMPEGDAIATRTVA